MISQHKLHGCPNLSWSIGILLEYVLSVSTERLNDQHPDRIRFFLSKADTAGVESDRQVRISTMLRECSLSIVRNLLAQVLED